MDGILEYFEKKYPDLHVRDVIECGEPIDLNELSKEYCKEQLRIGSVSKSVACGNCDSEESDMYCQKCYDIAYDGIGY